MSEAQEDKAKSAAADTAPPAPSPEAAAGAEEAGPSRDKELPSLTGPGLRVRYSGRSAVGLVREHNEDNLVIANLSTGAVSPREETCGDEVGDGGLLFAVCDGMGGAAAGEVASQMAVELLLEAMRRGGKPKDRDELARRLVSVVEEAGKRIFDAAQKERSRRGMGTTATVAALVDKVLFLAEVGDSRGYLLRGGVLKQLTKDQSLVNQLIEAGHLTEAEAEAFEHSNIILQALGTSETVQVDLTFVELRKGDRVMMCSDGLSGLVHADTIRDALSTIADPNECTATLVKYAEAGGGHDNITVLVIDFDGDALEAARETDTFGYLQYPLLPAGGGKDVFGDEEVTDSGAIEPVASAPRRSPLPDAMAAAEGEGADSGSWLWLSAGIAVLLVGAWVLAVSGSGESPGYSDESVLPQATPIAQAAPPTAAAEEARPVAVRVFSDVEGATLLVNGEARGQLSADRSHDMELRPGAYRFEAQSNGNVAAVEVVTVRPEVPLDVHLRLPSGAAEPSADKPSAGGTQTAAKLVPEADKAPAKAAEPVAKVAPQVAPKPTSDAPAPLPTAASKPADAPAAKPRAVEPEAAPTPAPAPKAAPAPAPAPAVAPKTAPAADEKLPQNPF